MKNAEMAEPSDLIDGEEENGKGLKMKKWEISRIREARKDEIAALSAALKISPLTAALLTERGCETAVKGTGLSLKTARGLLRPVFDEGYGKGGDRH